jgi:hypothetical protein
MEDPLDPASRYFRTVRARFAVDGRPRVMRRSPFEMIDSSCSVQAVPSWLYHRFVTPR